LNDFQFATLIDAKPELVWNTMLAPDTYKAWTAVFAEGSHFEGSWNTGDRIRFLIPDGSGMTSVIAENRPHEFLSIKHLGYVKEGIEDTESEQVKSWAPAFENYTLSAIGSSTEVKVEFAIPPELEDYMTTTWPEALAKLKSICEAPAARAE